MNKNILPIIVVFFLSSTYGFAQNLGQGIIFPKSNASREFNCKQCYTAFKQRPKEVTFSIQRENNNLYFQTNDKKWFDLLFKNPKDGIAVDVVNKNIL